MKEIKYRKTTEKSYDGKKNNSILIDEASTFQLGLKGKTFKMGKLIYGWIGKDNFWIRFLKGYGIHVSNLKKGGYITFSERNGYTKYYKIFNYKLKFLKP